MFKFIPETNNRFMVDEKGTIKRVAHLRDWKTRSGKQIKRYMKERIVSLGTSRLGYRYFKYKEKKVCRQILAHRAVLSAHFRPPFPGEVCNHIDGNPSNNHIDNLEWCTQRHNEIHSFRILGKRPHNTNISWDDILMIVDDKRSHAALAKELNCRPDSIMLIRKRYAPTIQYDDGRYKTEFSRLSDIDFIKLVKTHKYKSIANTYNTTQNCIASRVKRLRQKGLL